MTPRKEFPSQAKTCPCEGHTLEKLIRPALLIILAEGDEYGYKIARRLSGMPMYLGRNPNATGVYRCLKSMTEEGLATASWQLPESGPAKRLFTITPAGIECLKAWMKTLAGYREAIAGLLDHGNKVVAAKTAEKKCCCSRRRA